MRTKYFLSLILMLCVQLSTLQALDKNEIETHLNNLLNNLETISFKFTDVSHQNLSGSINASKGNKYKIITKDRTVICNGDKIWNYSESDNKVIISDFDSERVNLSIEGVFFGLIKKMSLEKFTKEHSSKNTDKLYIVTYKANNEISKKYKISIVKLWVNSQKDIKYISTEYNNSINRWKIDDLKINPKIKAEIFKFKAPEKCKIIELD